MSAQVETGDTRINKHITAGSNILLWTATPASAPDKVGGDNRGVKIGSARVGVVEIIVVEVRDVGRVDVAEGASHVADQVLEGGLGTAIVDVDYARRGVNDGAR